MRISLRELFLIVTAICLGLGGYQLGLREATNKAYLHGYAEAQDHYQVMLSAYAKDKQAWLYIGNLWRKYPNMTIIGEPFNNEDQWKVYVQYHAQRNGWKDAGVFKVLSEAEREYAETKRIGVNDD